MLLSLMQIADMPNTKKYKYILKFMFNFSQTSTVKVIISYIIIIFEADHNKIYSLYQEFSLTIDEKLNNLDEFQLGFRLMDRTICVCVCYSVFRLCKILNDITGMYMIISCLHS